MKWQAQVLGDEMTLARLADLFVCPPVQIINDPEYQHIMVCEAFASLSTEGEVAEVAKKALAVIAGIASLESARQTNLRVGAVYEVRPDGNRNVYVFPVGIESQAMRGNLSVAHASQAGVVLAATKSPVLSSFEAAVLTPALANALRLYGNDAETWAGLYKSLEAIERGAGQSRLAKFGWAKKGGDRERFRRTANSVGATGLDARHGVEIHVPPANPMPLGEAKAFVRGLLEKWLLEERSCGARSA